MLAALTRSFAPPLLLLLIQGCGECKAPGFDEGEQFRITISGVRSPTSECDTPLLMADDSFVLVGGPTLADGGDGSQCQIRGARPEVPTFADGILTSCETRNSQLGLACMGTTATGCDVGASMGVGPTIERGVSTIERGTFRLTWIGSSCYPGGLCGAVYDARIERLGP
jgi:hypothetical protein